MTPVTQIKALPRVLNVATRVVHSVYAGGGPEDGSLHLMTALCGTLVIGDTNNGDNPWVEVYVAPTCGNCRRSTYWRQT